MRSIYLDYNATTPLDPGVRAAMLPFLDEIYGNPSSIHHVGRRARALLDDARDRVARVLGCRPSELVFTSGGTEACNLAVLGAARRLRERGRHIITSAVEHHAVLNACEYLARREDFTLTCVPVNAEGIVEPDTVANILRPDTVLVSIMAANNESGAKQPVAEIGALCRQRGVAFHTDAVQVFGKESFASIHQFNADLVSVCGHKFHGPKGAGLLFVRSPFNLDPLLLGGGHENERRAGTENLPAILGLTAAIERFIQEPVFPQERLWTLTAKVIARLDTLPGVTFRGSRDTRLSNTVAFTVEAADSITLLAALDLEGVCASGGAACSAGSLQPSHVMLAMGVPPAAAKSLVRFSLGRESTAEEIDTVLDLLPMLIKRSQEHSPVKSR
ncbi:MAG: cysteine desulfurase [Verrucomicrobia bacterium]|nr:cysteine desulfurase [Verrucomicrobiota bacterium]